MLSRVAFAHRKAHSETVPKAEQVTARFSALNENNTNHRSTPHRSPGISVSYITGTLQIAEYTIKVPSCTRILLAECLRETSHNLWSYCIANMKLSLYNTNYPIYTTRLNYSNIYTTL